MVDNNLPPNWSWVKLGDIGEVVAGGTPSTKVQKYFNGDIAWITPADLTGYKNKYISRGKRNITKEGLKNSSARLVPEGSILFSSRAPIGYVVIASNHISTNQGFKNLIPNKKVDSEFVYYYLKSAKQLAEEKASGTTFKEISAKNFAKLPFPLPPLPEQKKIVEKIEELFSDLENGIASLKKAKEQIKLYRQSVLSSAFNGKLTSGHPELVSGSNGLPKGWKWVKLDEVIDSMQYGTSDKAVGSSDGIPVLRMGNIQDGKLDYSKLKYFEKSYEDLKKYLLDDGDLLFNRTNSAELVGKTALYKKRHPKSIFASYLIRVKVNKSIYSSEFLNYYINSSYGRDFIKSVVSQNVGQANVNGTKLKSMSVPLIPLNLQTQIVEEIESRFSEAYNLEKAVDESLTKAEALRQSILKQAFEGKLI